MNATKALTRRRPWLDAIALVTLGVALAFAFATPPEATQGNVARLFYVHVPTILVAYGCFATVLIGGVGYLLTRRSGWDHLAVAGAEVGVVFTGLTIVIGMVWAKPTWGVYWTWSARLTLTAVLFFTYLGYLALRRAIEDPRARARRAAVYGILSIVLIPIVHFSVLWWRDVHQPPTLLRPDEMQIDGILLTAFLVGLVAYTIVAVALIARRYDLAAAEEELDRALRTGPGAIAGDAVATPQLEPRS
jgi:heme exporter protein C